MTGSLAIQLAKHRFGAGRVVAAGRDTGRLQRLAELGADTTVRLHAAVGRLETELRRLHAEHPFDLVRGTVPRTRGAHLAGAGQQ